MALSQHLSLLLTAFLVSGTLGRGDLRFECGEDRSIETSYVCDGDDDCFWGTDESEQTCRNYTRQNTDVWQKWLAHFMNQEYLKFGGCGQPDVLPKFRARRLVEGEEAIRGSWPWQTAMVKKDDQLVYCGGTLIHGQWVLTAAHCIESLGDRIENLELWFGRNDVTIPEVGSQKRLADAVFKHPNHRYPAHKSNDIGLVKLDKPVDRAPYVHLACLPTCVTNEALDHCYLAGWGRVSGVGRRCFILNAGHIRYICHFYSHFGKTFRLNPTEPKERVVYPANLHQLRFPMVPHDLCTSDASWGARITSKQVCAGGDGRHDMCWGDSGGGLVCWKQGRHTLHGVSSFTGHLCSVEMRPAILTKVDRYLSWIGSIIAKDTL